MEGAVRIEDVGDAARHASGEVASGRTEHDYPAAGHVFATVVAHRFNHRAGAAVAHAEALAGHPADVNLAAGRAVEGNVADDHVLFRGKIGLGRR